MTRILNLITPIALSALMFSAPVSAQDTSTEKPADETGEVGGLQLGETVNPEDLVGQTYIRESFDDWEMRCMRTGDGIDPCNLYQLLQDEQGNSVAEISVFDLPPGGQAVLGATVVTPLETLLTQQITMSIDDGLGKRYPFNHCSTLGCFSRIGLTEEDLAALRKGATATMTIVPVLDPTSTVKLQMSLKGFTAGIKAVTDSNAELPQ